jgi:hypothetical protein
MMIMSSVAIAITFAITTAAEGAGEDAQDVM